MATMTPWCQGSAAPTRLGRRWCPADAGSQRPRPPWRPRTPTPATWSMTFSELTPTAPCSSRLAPTICTTPSTVPAVAPRLSHPGCRPRTPATTTSSPRPVLHPPFRIRPRPTLDSTATRAPRARPEGPVRQWQSSLGNQAEAFAPANPPFEVALRSLALQTVGLARWLLGGLHNRLGYGRLRARWWHQVAMTSARRSVLCPGSQGMPGTATEAPWWKASSGLCRRSSLTEAKNRAEASPHRMPRSLLPPPG